MLSLAVWLRTSLQGSPLAPFFFCISQDQVSGSLLNNQYFIRFSAFCSSAASRLRQAAARRSKDPPSLRRWEALPVQRGHAATGLAPSPRLPPADGRANPVR